MPAPRLTPLLVAALTLGALAASVTPAYAEDRATAGRYFRMGEKAYRAQDFEAAAQNFEEAYEHYALPEIAFSAAQAYRRQYRIDPRPEYVALAVKHYKTYLGKVKSGGRVADAADALSEMQQELETLIKSGVKVSDELARDYTRIAINVALGREVTSSGMQEVDDAEGKVVTKVSAKLDGKPVAPFANTNVSPGKHTVEASAEGYFTETKVENVQPGQAKIVDIELRPRPAKVRIETESGARVLIDGRPQAASPQSGYELPAGRHVISVLHRGRNPVAREVVLHRGQQVTIDAPLDKTFRRTLVPWILVGAGVAGAFSGTNVVLAVRRDARASELLQYIQRDGDESQATLDAYNDARRWRDRYVTAAWISGAACVGLAGVATLLFYTDNPSPDGVRVEPLATSGGAGAAIAGRF